MSASATPTPATGRVAGTAILRVPDVSLPSAWHLWERNASIYRRTYRINILPNFFEPFFYLLAMGLGLGAYLGDRILGFDYVDYIAPGLAATAAMFGTSFEVTFNCFVKMQFGKIYDAAMATPLSIEDIGLGELLWGTTRALIYGQVFVLIAAAFGVVHTPLVIASPIAITLIGLMFSVIGLTFTAIIPLIDYFTYYWTLFITPMFLFSGIFFPLDRLPGWAQVLAWFMPLHHAVNLMRAITLTGDVAAALLAGAWIVTLTGLLFVLPLNLLRRRLVR
ncbi:MAG TPA: ABC transporter permease [Actinomycetota bacterium]|nr:ABC transporter permease [Actinomycetota bacterium]